MNNNTEKISISYVIPCFDAGSSVIDAVNSILAQEGNFLIREVVIVDDKSDDAETLDSLARLSALRNISVIRSKENRGSGHARNVGIRKVRSEWIGFLDADDLLFPGAVSSLLKGRKAFPDAEWLGADFQLWRDGRVVEESFLCSREMSRSELLAALDPKRPYMFRRPVDRFLRANLGQVGVSLVRKALLGKISGFDESLRQAQDYDLWVRLAMVSDFVFVPESVMAYRIHGGNITWGDNPPRRWAIKAFEKYYSDPEYSDYKDIIRRRLSAFYLEDSVFFRKKRKKTAAIACAAKSVRYVPQSVKSWEGLFAAPFA